MRINQKILGNLVRNEHLVDKQTDGIGKLHLICI